MNLRTLLALVALTLVGCAYDPPKNEAKGSAASNISGAGTEFYEVPQGAGYVTPAVNFPSSYFGGAEVERACGGNYSIDVSVAFGEVTATTMTVEAVMVTFHSPGVGATDGTVDIYSYESHRANGQYLPRRDGETVRYEIDRVFTVSEGHAVVFDVHSKAGMPGIDGADASETFTCGQNAQLAFYPSGATEGGAQLPLPGPQLPAEPEPVAEPVPAQPETPRTGDDCADGLIAPQLNFCGKSPGTENKLYRCEAGAWVEASPCTEGCMPAGYGEDYCY